MLLGPPRIQLRTHAVALRKMLGWFVGRQPHFLLCQGLALHPMLIISHYSLIGNELLVQTALETNAWAGVIFRKYVCCGGNTS